jgi:hypothetical protein
MAFILHFGIFLRFRCEPVLVEGRNGFTGEIEAPSFLSGAHSFYLRPGQINACGPPEVLSTSFASSFTSTTLMQSENEVDKMIQAGEGMAEEKLAAMVGRLDNQSTTS